MESKLKEWFWFGMFFSLVMIFLWATGKLSTESSAINTFAILISLLGMYLNRWKFDLHHYGFGRDEKLEVQYYKIQAIVKNNSGEIKTNISPITRFRLKQWARRQLPKELRDSILDEVTQHESVYTVTFVR